MALEYRHQGVLIVVASNTVAIVEALLMLEYRSIGGLCLLKLAISRLGTRSSNTHIVYVIGLL